MEAEFVIDSVFCTFRRCFSELSCLPTPPLFMLMAILQRIHHFFPRGNDTGLNLGFLCFAFVVRPIAVGYKVVNHVLIVELRHAKSRKEKEEIRTSGI
jgi:hypothetical protein